MSKCTKGEWRVLDNRLNIFDHGLVHVVAGNGLTVATINNQIFDESGDSERMANAYVMAASKMLLDALQDCLDELKALRSAPDSAYARPDDSTIDKASAAISKATGEQA